MIRVGQGFDAHRFKKDDTLIIGGVNIPYEYGLEAHSDGDVLIHALIDALLGAAALGDIGQHFPDHDQHFKNMDSRILLRQVWVLLQEKQYVINNIDLTVIAQAPKMAPFIGQMCFNIAADLGLPVGAVNVKATTTEMMGFTGRKEGIAALAIVLLTADDYQSNGV